MVGLASNWGKGNLRDGPGLKMAGKTEEEATGASGPW